MEPDLEYRGLLDDVLAEAAPTDFERSLLDGTLRAVRRRRRSRRLARGVTATGLFATIALVVWNSLWPTSPVTSARTTLTIVHTQALPPSMLVRTKPGGLSVVRSSAATYLMVETGSIKDPFKEIDDEQLLALAKGHPVALVRQGPHQAQLLFLSPEDKNGFPVQ